MSKVDVMESLCSEWDDSSQNSNDGKGGANEFILDNVTVEETIVPTESIGTVTSTPMNDEVSVDSNFDHLISEETISDSETLLQKSSLKLKTVPGKKKRTKKTTPKSKPTKPKRKTPTKKQITKNEKSDKSEAAPSVYSRNQIARHTKRMNKLKALEEQTDSEAGSEPDTDAALDRDLDINLRIFEESVQSVDKVVIGEIQCNILDDKSCAEIINANKNPPNIFKVSVNTNFISCDNEKSPEKNRTNGNSNIDDIEISDDPLEFSDNDSDLEILVSKPIVRKRASQPPKKEKSTDKKQKLTMYDLIHDSVLLSPKTKEESSDSEQKEDLKTNETKKTKVTNKKLKLKKEEQAEDMNLSVEKKEENNQNLPVPKLKVNADGEVVIDMDSLVIEQTGVSEARNAIANSEVVEEHSLSYKSYNKKNSFRKQWTPHETLKFYQVLSTIGTDFTLMATLFPGRTRKCMKRKFKREEKSNAELILKALSCKQNFNIDLLEKELQLKEEKVNLFKENSKKQKPVKKKAEKVQKPAPSADKKPKGKRKSFFESSVSSFRNS